MVVAQSAGLVADADLVAEVAASLGKLGKSQDLVQLVAQAKSKTGGQDLSTDEEAKLRLSMNDVLVNLAPITLGDLRKGWRPFTRSARQEVLFWIVMLIAFAVLVQTGYLTLVYEKTSSFLTSAKELQASHTEESMETIYFTIRSLKLDDQSGRAAYLNAIKDVASIRQQMMSEASYAAISSDINGSLLSFDLANHVVGGLWIGVFEGLDLLLPRERRFCPRGQADCVLSLRQAEKNARQAPSAVEDHREKLKKACQSEQMAAPAPAPAPALAAPAPALPAPPAIPAAGGAPDLKVGGADGKLPHCVIMAHVDDINLVMGALGLDFNPRDHKNYLADVHHLKTNIDLLGKWVLPALYGVFGAMLFFMRHYVDPSQPDPTLGKLLYRLMLGGIAGVIMVWFWTPAPQAPNTIQLTSLSAFGVAFLIGFSTDVLFSVLDRFSKALSDTLGKPGTT
ncbi:hypothetical protein V5F29_02365 [Xanthobacter aminoxidans]|uniref:hypothetical protein n=1 Tax=Xanthobacter aminoxidans TaxID=186280 RepID=UPI00372C0D80